MQKGPGISQSYQRLFVQDREIYILASNNSDDIVRLLPSTYTRILTPLFLLRKKPTLELFK